MKPTPPSKPRSERLGKRLALPERLPLRWAAAAVLMLLTFCAGLVAGADSDLTPRREAGPVLSLSQAWRQAVAEYQALYTYATLASQSEDGERQSIELARASKVIGVALPLDAVKVESLRLKRAQILKFQGMPLVQLAYLRGRTPVAFCIVRNNQADAPPQVEVRKGMHLVHWARGGRAYMVIGDLSEEEIGRVAAVLRARLG